MKSAGRNILFFLFYVPLCFASENKPVALNREILFALGDSVINKIFVQQLQSYPSVTIKTSTDTFTTFFRQHFISNLASKKISVFENSNATETTLELSVQESSVFFGEPFTESFLGRKKIERSIQLVVNATGSSSVEGKILWSRQFSETMIDTVNFTDAEQMNNSSLPMTSIQKPKLSFFDSVVEPVIVIFSTGVAIYLFFTIRS
jgi:hypothetical protein